MVFALYILSLLIGFGLLVYFGDKLVDNAVSIAQKLNLPSSVIAVTLLAAGTSAPELVTSFLAAYQKSPDISLGNVVGSNIFNLMAVGGITIFLQPSGNNKKAFFSWPFLLAGSLIFTYFLSDLLITTPEGVAMLVFTLAFIVFSLKAAPKDTEEIPPEPDQKLFKLFLWTNLSFAGLVGGAQLALYGGVGLGEMAGLSERVIGITIISIGTGLPELATSVAAAIKGRGDMAIGNILGSNIYNTAAVPGVTASIFPLAAHKNLLVPDTMIMLAATLLIGLVFAFSSKKINRTLGCIFFLGYIGYATLLLLKM